ncbi:hypothetical protein ABTY59_36335 [Streptomyces sp. NPDC096079]
MKGFMIQAGRRRRPSPALRTWRRVVRR